ncbi:MAG TPA: class I SAM-dependent methyltransferase [Pyrinomonadaceae bacterium]|jgi:ubiquinone/menaquinone biosynthesis C-methylase UbiE
MNIKKILTDFSEGMSKINVNENTAALSDSDRAAIKGNVAVIYDLTAYRSQKGDLWNWGMHNEELDREINERIPNYNKFDTDGFSEELYFYTLKEIPISFDDYADKTILEVGCGVGEGLNFLSRIVNCRSAIGLDLSKLAIDRANARLARGDMIKFVHGDAENLPFENNELDVVINIESSHTYPNLERFLAEVARVLKPGGYFSHVDIFTRERYQQMSQLKQDIKTLRWLKENDVSEDVKASITRRMQPDSFLRKTHQEKRPGSLIERLLGERTKMIMYGSSFINHQYGGFSNMAKKIFMPSTKLLPVESYRYSLAVKEG